MFNVKLTAGAVAMGLVLAGSAAAQQGQAGGTTSGPAAGSAVEPSAATQKKAHTHKSSAVSAGAPGVEAKKGLEGGQKPKAK